MWVVGHYLSAAGQPQGRAQREVVTMSDATVAPVSAGDRVTWLKKNTGKLAVALVLLVLAGVAVAATLGAFTSSSANVGNVVATGSLSIDDDLDGGAIFSAEGLVPGDQVTGEVSITNTGESSGTFSLASANLTDTPGAGGGNLSEVLELTITDDGTEVYSGPLDLVAPVQLGEWAGGESHTFVFTVLFPDTGTADDNDFQNASVSVDYLWSAVS